MNFEKIRHIAAAYQDNAKAPLGFVFRDLQSGREIAFHGDSAFPTASTFKVFLLAELYRSVHAGACSLSDRILLSQDSKCIGGGVLEWIDPGASLTLKDYAMLMMMISDNTATDVLYQFIGRESIRKNVIEALNLTRTKVDFSCAELIDRYYEMEGRSIEEMLLAHGGVPPSYRNSRWYRCETEKNNQTSPLDMAKLLELLYRGLWVNQETSDQIIDVLKACQTNGRIPHDLPEFLPVAHKTGTLDRLCADVGIVYTGRGDYILCLYYNGNLASQEDYDRDGRNRIGEPYLAALSKEIYDAYME